MNLPAIPDSAAAQLRAALQAAGLKVTRQRTAVYQTLLHLGHPTTDEVYLRVRNEFATVSLATVYNALDVLVASGLVTRIMPLRGSSRYDARRDHHYHLRCSKSGLVVDLETRFVPDLISRVDPDLEGDLSQQGFRVTGYRLEVLGYFDDAN